MTAGPLATRSDLRLMLSLVAVAVAARAITFGNPLVHLDEEFYFVAARGWIDGAIPYVDLWDRKPIGLLALYLPAAALGYPAGIWAYQALALACVAATAWGIVRLARAGGWGAGAGLAAAAYILWLNLAGGQGGQSPAFYNLAMAAAAWLLLGDRAARPGRALAAMALVGVALQIKSSVVFEGMFFGLWALARHWLAQRRPGRTMILGAAMIAVALIPTALAALGYARIGQFDAWSYANVTSILARRPAPIAEQLGNLGILILLLSPMVAMSVVAWRDSPRTPARQFVFGWLASAIGGLLAFGSWFDHYALPAMLPAAICTAGAIAARADVRRWAVPVLAIVAIGGQALLIDNRLKRGSPGEFAALAAAVGQGPGCLWVQSGPTMLYVTSRRCRPSRFVFPSHLGRAREDGAIGVDQASEVRRILALRPAIVVMRPPYRGERPDLRAIAAAAMARGYRLKAVVPLGRERVRVFASTSP